MAEREAVQHADSDVRDRVRKGQEIVLIVGSGLGCRGGES